VESRVSEFESVLRELLGRFSQHSLPGVQRLPNKDIWMEFARQFSIAQTFGQNRSSVEEEGSNRAGPGIHEPGSLTRIIHEASTAAADPGMSTTALRSFGLLS
jgi:hypothetical protein